eukprot:12011053-Alexandrium_andersonii.AAC.1
MDATRAPRPDQNVRAFVPFPLLVRWGRGVTSHTQHTPLLYLDWARFGVRTLGLDRAPDLLERAQHSACLLYTSDAADDM